MHCTLRAILIKSLVICLKLILIEKVLYMHGIHLIFLNYSLIIRMTAYCLLYIKIGKFDKKLSLISFIKVLVYVTPSFVVSN